MKVLIYIFVFLISLAGVEAFRRWILRRGITDVPNERSLHVEPTARGGGLIIVVVCLTIYAIYTNTAADNFQWTYFTGAALIALVSWLDDLYTIPAIWRLLVHTFSAALIIFGIGYFQEIYIPFFQKINVPTLGAVLSLLWIVWLTNAYNFMDGIDGIAGAQAVIAGAGWLIIGNYLGLTTVGFYGGVVACASLGFLIENWQPAKIFMGDVGSAFLGYTFAVFPLLEGRNRLENLESRQYLPSIAVLLVWLFFFDSMYTFVRRILNTEKIWQPHRRHIYQRLVIKGHSHQTVTFLYGLLSILTVATVFLLAAENQRRAVWEITLTALVLIQSFGLLYYTRLFGKRIKGSA